MPLPLKVEFKFQATLSLPHHSEQRELSLARLVSPRLSGHVILVHVSPWLLKPISFHATQKVQHTQKTITMIPECLPWWVSSSFSAVTWQRHISFGRVEIAIGWQNSVSVHSHFHDTACFAGCWRQVHLLLFLLFHNGSFTTARTAGCILCLTLFSLNTRAFVAFAPRLPALMDLQFALYKGF